MRRMEQKDEMEDGEETETPSSGHDTVNVTKISWQLWLPALGLYIAMAVQIYLTQGVALLGGVALLE